MHIVKRPASQEFEDESEHGVDQRELRRNEELRRARKGFVIILSAATVVYGALAWWFQ